MADAFFVGVQSVSEYLATIRNYKYKEDTLVEWLKTNCPDCMNGNVVALERITTTNFFNFLSKVSINSKNGAMLSSSTPTGFRSMIIDMYSRSRIDVPSDFERESKIFDKGCKNKIAEARAAGTIPTAGSDKLPMNDYKALAAFAAQSSDTIYAHGFLVIIFQLFD